MRKLLIQLDWNDILIIQVMKQNDDLKIIYGFLVLMPLSAHQYVLIYLV